MIEQSEKIGGKGRQDPGKADPPCTTGTHVGKHGPEGEKDVGNARAPPTQATAWWGDNGWQSETKGDKTFGKADAPSNEGKQEGHSGKHKNREKVDTLSNKGK